MAQNYECALLMDPMLADEAVQGYLDQFAKLVTDRGGEMLHIEKWGKRRLEYPIEKRTEAIFAFLFFRMESAGDLVNEFERQVRITENLLREMTIKAPDLKICKPPISESRFSESARLAHAGGRRGGFGRRDYGDRSDSRSPEQAETREGAEAPVAAEAPAAPAPEAAEAPATSE